MKGSSRRTPIPSSVPEQYAAVGTDDKQLPGGIPHVQPQTVPEHAPLDPGPPRDYYRGEMAGGVPVHSSSNGKPRQDRWEQAAGMATVVPEIDVMPVRPVPVPVVIISPDAGFQPLSVIAAYQVTVPATGFIQLAGRDLKRSHITICNEDASNPVRFAQSGISAVTGFYVAKASSSPRFESQEQVWAYSPSGSAVKVSVLLEYGISEGQ